MTIQYLKKATKTAATGEDDVSSIVTNMLKSIETGGEQKVIEYTKELDKWDGEILVSEETLAAAEESVTQQMKDDIQFAHERVRKFAEHQLAALTEFETELSPGLFAGQRLIPMNTAGCYVPGGRYSHVASAIMSITTAKVAGVQECGGLLTRPSGCWGQPGHSLHHETLWCRPYSGAGRCAGDRLHGPGAVYRLCRRYPRWPG